MYLLYTDIYFFHLSGKTQEPKTLGWSLFCLLLLLSAGLIYQSLRLAALQWVMDIRKTNDRKKPQQKKQTPTAFMHLSHFLDWCLCVCVCLHACRTCGKDWRMMTLTNTCGHSAVPLGQGIGHSLAPDGIGAVQRVAWTAFKQYCHTDAKVIPYPLPKAGLRDWATLSGTCPRDS